MTVHLMPHPDDFWYLATPYSKYPGGIHAAFVAACRQAGLLIRSGVPVFSPIAHTHPIAIEAELDPMDLEMWLTADRPFMAHAHGIIMCRLDGWEDSVGMEHERKFFHQRGKPVHFMFPGLVPAACLGSK